MRLSIITPSFNHVRFVERTITSVLDQGFKNLEYIVIDGGSRDGSVDIIKKYEKYLSYWHSKPDAGQSAAINYGLTRATGDIIAYINSDDYYAPDCFRRIEDAFRNPSIQWIAGLVDVVDANEEHLFYQVPSHQTDFKKTLVWGVPIGQPGVFWRADLFNRFGHFDETLYPYIFDTEFLIRLLDSSIWPVRLDGSTLAYRRLHGSTKTETAPEKYIEELDRLCQSYLEKRSDIDPASIDNEKLRKRVTDLLNKASIGFRGGKLFSPIRFVASAVATSPLETYNEIRSRVVRRAGILTR